MSLRDTIEGARREAEGNVVGRPKKEVESLVGDDERKGFSRSSAAKARPAREAAASVRSASKPDAGVFGKSETKEEKRDRKRREREESDLKTRAYDLVLRNMPEYRRTDRIFWIVVGVGMAFAIVSLVGMYAFGNEVDITTVQGMVASGSLLVAYACIIGAIIYDFVKRRPFRKQAQASVNGLSEKRLVELFEQERAKQLARKAAKEARRRSK